VATKALKAVTVEDELNARDSDTLHQAMARAFAEIEAATKSADNPFFKSKYADLGAIIGTVKPALVAHGLFFTQHCHPSEDGVIVETVLHHRNGESLSMGQLYVPANKRDPQGFGSAQTYARRYALQTAFGVPAEDDDGNAATKAVSDRPSTGETPPNKRVEYKSLDGKNPPPYTCPTQLMTASREFVRTLNSMGDLGEFIAWSKTDDVKDFVKQLKRDMPDWWSGGASVPTDFVPLEILVAQKKRDLEQIDELNTRTNA
jgi:hypothetical protein